MSWLGHIRELVFTLGGQISLYIVVKVTSFFLNIFQHLSTRYDFVCQQFCCEAVRAILNHSYAFAAKQYPDKVPLWNLMHYPFWWMHVMPGFWAKTRQEIEKPDSSSLAPKAAELQGECEFGVSTRYFGTGRNRHKSTKNKTHSCNELIGGLANILHQVFVVF